MKQVLHLLIVDPDKREALADWHGRTWLLPVIVLDERLRAGLAIPIWLSAHHFPRGRFIGQWLCRADSSGASIDWLAVVRAATGETSTDAAPRLTRLSTLREAPALIPYQQFAVRRALSCSELPTTSGPFGSLTWPDDLDAWVNALADGARDPITEAIVHRATAYELVVEYRRPQRRHFFKGLDGDRSVEPRLTAQLAGVAKESFPGTTALETRPDRSVWWLMEECRGSALALQPTAATAIRVARHFARVQRDVAGAIKGGRINTLERLNLSTRLTWAAGLLHDVCEREAADATLSTLERACRLASAFDAPWSWLPADFDPANVLVDDEGVRFIDVGESLCGPAPIAIGTFATRLRRYGLHCKAAVWNAYAQAWNPALDIQERACDFEAVSALIEAHLDWQRVVKKTEHSEVEGVLGPARLAIARRLVNAAVSTTRAAII